MVTFCANIYGPLDGGMVTLQHSAGSSTQRNFVADFIRLKFKFIQQTHKNHFMSHPLGDLGPGNVRSPSIARWKARGRLPIRHNRTLFAISYG